MVERKVKLMSVQASPAVKKIAIVFAIALGCDQKKASIQPVRAAISQSESAPMRMPICAATRAHVGQAFCTGRRRRTRDGGFAFPAFCCFKPRPASGPVVGVSETDIDRSSPADLGLA